MTNTHTPFDYLSTQEGEIHRLSVLLDAVDISSDEPDIQLFEFLLTACRRTVNQIKDQNSQLQNLLMKEGGFAS